MRDFMIYCDNESDIIECQKILFSMGYSLWSEEEDLENTINKRVVTNYHNSNEVTIVTYMDGKRFGFTRQSEGVLYSYFVNRDKKYVEFKDFKYRYLRPEKIKRIL